MSSNRYFANPFHLPSSSSSSSSLSSVVALASHPQTREDVTVSKEYLFQKAYQLFQKCCSYYEHHVPILHTDNKERVGMPEIPRMMDAKYIGSLYVGGLGPCVYLAWKVATSPFLSTLRATSTSDSSSTANSIPTIQLRRHLLHHALDVVQQSLHYHKWDYPRVTLLEGPVVGAFVMKCVILQSLRQDIITASPSSSPPTIISSTESDMDQEIQKSKHELLRIASIVQAMDSTQCEVLYGRAGYLSALSFLIQKGILTQSNMTVDTMHPHSVEPACLSIINDILKEIMSNGRQVALEERFILFSQDNKDTWMNRNAEGNKTEDYHKQHEEKIVPLLWKWHESYYLGAAHGIVGILHTILQFYPWIQNHLVLDNPSPSSSLISTWIRDTIDGLDDFCFPSSMNLNSSIDPNWNTYISQQKTITHLLSPKHDRLVHWCHGATGHVLLLLKAYDVFQEDKYLFKAQEIARRVIVPRGLLKKGVGLCHGKGFQNLRQT